MELLTAETEIRYAGFGKRMASHLIDYFIICFVIVNVYYFFNAMVYSWFEANPEAFHRLYPDSEKYDTYRMATAIAFKWALVFNVFFSWGYYAGFESSPWQATPGKKLMGLTITDVDGDRISFAKGSGRYFGKIISGLILGLGYLAILWTERKQGWHDQMSDCVVTEK